MTLLEKVLLAQVAIQTPAILWLCGAHIVMNRRVTQLRLKVFYKVEDKHE